MPLLFFFLATLGPAQITAMSLVAVFTNGISGSIAYGRLRRIDYKSGAIFLIATLPGSIAGAIIVNHIEQGPFQLSFGLLLSMATLLILLLPGHQLFTPKRVGSGWVRRLVDINGTVYQYRIRLRLGIVVAFMVGFLASMLGLGGGIIMVPFFVFLMGMPIQVATATSQFIIMGTSGIANTTNILQGDLSGLWYSTIALSTGTLIGAQIGARLSQRLKSTWITRSLAVGLLTVGLRLVYSGLNVTL